MKHLVQPLLIASACALVAQVQAQTPPSAPGVSVSTDPAQAAAVERAARDLQARQAANPASGSALVVHGRTDGGVDFVSGGVSVGARAAMHTERAHYSLWVATVAQGSGAYLSDTHLRIVGGGKVLVDRTMDGPWFFAALPPGRYEVIATMQADGTDAAQTLSQPVDVPASGQRQAVLRFVSSATVAPEMDSPDKGNPFGRP
jgi:hypothetical protein